MIDKRTINEQLGNEKGTKREEQEDNKSQRRISGILKAIFT